MKCQDCLYWQQSSKQREEGACRRNAPRAKHVERDWPEDALCLIAWPRTKASDWCGEFKKRDKGQAAVY